MASVSDSPVSLATWRASCSVALFLMNKGMFLCIYSRELLYGNYILNSLDKREGIKYV